MFYFVVAAGFEDVVESDEVGFYIGIRIGDTVENTCLCGKVHNNLWLILGEEVFNEFFVGNVALYEGKVGYCFNSSKRFSLRRTS